MSSEIADIVTDILRHEAEKRHLSDEIKGLKDQARDLGYSKKGLAEALRLAKLEDLERNLTLTSASTILTEMGRAPINPNFNP